MMLCKKYFPARDDTASSNKNTKKSEKGAIAVEYALGMLVASFFMMGVELLFRRMAIDIIRFFKQLVAQFPNI